MRVVASVLDGSPRRGGWIADDAPSSEFTLARDRKVKIRGRLPNRLPCKIDCSERGLAACGNEPNAAASAAIVVTPVAIRSVIGSLPP